MGGIDDHIHALFLGQLLDDGLHFGGSLAQNVLAVALKIGLEVVGNPLRVPLLALALVLQVGHGVLVQLAAVELLFNRLEIGLELAQLVLAGLVLGFDGCGGLLELLRVGHGLLCVDYRDLYLGGSHRHETRKAEGENAEPENRDARGAE